MGAYSCTKRIGVGRQGVVWIDKWYWDTRSRELLLVGASSGRPVVREGEYLAEGSVVVEGSLAVGGEGEGGGRVLGAGTSGGEAGEGVQAI